MADKHSNFPGTYFNKDAALRMAQGLRVMAWIVLIIYGGQLILSVAVNILQILRGFWAGMGFTDMVQNFLYAFQQPLHGVVYSFALWGISHLLLIFLDIEDNTRRAARGTRE